MQGAVRHSHIRTAIGGEKSRGMAKRRAWTIDGRARAKEFGGPAGWHSRCFGSTTVTGISSCLTPLPASLLDFEQSEPATDKEQPGQEAAAVV